MESGRTKVRVDSYPPRGTPVVVFVGPRRADEWGKGPCRGEGVPTSMTSTPDPIATAAVSTASHTGRVFQRLDTTAKAPYPRSWYVRKLLWLVVWHTLYRLSPRPLRKFRVLLVRSFGGRVPYTVNLLPSSRIWHPWLVTIGEYACLADGVLIYNLGPVAIGAHTVLSQDAYVCAGTHDYTKPNLPLQRPPVTIGAGVWVCTKAFVGPGVTVGDNAIVGACAVVMHNVPPDVIVQGNPASVVKPRRMDDGAPA